MANLYGYIIRMWKRILQKIFHFDKWHISSLDQRKYAQDILLHCNQRKQEEYFAEIGCGLGDIIRNIDFHFRVGFDIDKNVLKAVSFLSRITGQKNIRFAIFNFPDSPLPDEHDVILMVNWIHHIEPAILKNKLLQYFSENLREEGEIIIDTVQDPAYRYNHDIRFLTKDLNCSIHCLGQYARQREVWVIKKLK